jgi:hypothetical protein
MRIHHIIMAGLALFGAGASVPASAAVIASVSAAGQATASLSGYNFYMDNLNSSANGLQNLSFAGSSITGTALNGWVNVGSANVYGGAGGTGQFGTVYGDTTYQLSQGVNYFGLWGSALDGNNTVQIYNNETLLGTYALQSLLQNSSGFNNGYYGNPFGGGNGGELYAFFNFQSDTAFNRVTLLQNGGGGFEFDNMTVGLKSAAITAPEPGTWAMLLLGFGAIGWQIRQRRPATAMRLRAA